ncbi:hypothetical protein [Pedobacter sp.]|uniref:hypothetical protein n=1 Tax=Pedobacter sp. TaxID=1411316 RepID=UPI003BA9614A
MCIKRAVLLGVVIVMAWSASPLQAQTWPEWFAQKKTQKKYLLEQLAALKLYAGYLKKGYEIGSSGLDLIKDAGRGELDLHGAFFSSLKTVSPAIKKNVRIAEIIEMQLAISSTCASFRHLGNLSDDNRRYIDQVSTGLLVDCLSNLEDLLLVISSGRLELSDEERLSRIDQLYLDMQQKRIFTSRFSLLLQSLERDRAQEIRGIKEMEDIYEN